MKDIKSDQGLILNHLSHEYNSDVHEQKGKIEQSSLSPREVAAKIWDQWMQYRLLTIHFNSYAEFKINNPD